MAVPVAAMVIVVAVEAVELRVAVIVEVPAASAMEAELGGRVTVGAGG